MRLTSEEPSTWKELQDLVCKYLNEAGYEAVSPKTIETVRGEVEVDVYATAKHELIRSFICECKHWKSAVPKEKVHAFRTVVQDSGATLGILISKGGFQSGAVEAARCSNVLLKDWDGFLAMIADQWLFQRLLRLKQTCGPLAFYTSPFDPPLEKLTASARERYLNLLPESTDIYIHGRLITKAILNKEQYLINDIFFSACNDLFEYLEKQSIDAINKFQSLFDECGVEIDDFAFLGYIPAELTDDN